MNRREMTLLVALGAVLGVGALTFGFAQYYYYPLKKQNDAIAKLRMEVENKQAEVDKLLADLDMLNEARHHSLPADPAAAVADYSRYLHELLRENELQIDSLQSPPPVDQKPPAPGQANQAKKALHQILTFQVRARGELDAVVNTLESLQKTPVMHRVKTLSLDRLDMASRPAHDRLNVTFTIEAMIVSRAADFKAKPPAEPVLAAPEAFLAYAHLPAGLGIVPWYISSEGPGGRLMPTLDISDRVYDDIPRKNIFAGLQPVPKKQTDRPSDYGIEVAEYVRLEMTDPEGREAFFRNRVFKARPIRLKSSKYSPFNTFGIKNENQDKTLYRGKVLKIELRDVYFQVQDNVYRIHVGRTLKEAMRHALTEEEVELFGLTGFYDAEWAAREIEAAEAVAAKEETGKKGKGPQRKGMR